MNDPELHEPLQECAEDAQRTLVRRLGSATEEDKQPRGSEPPTASAAFRTALRSADEKLLHPQPK